MYYDLLNSSNPGHFSTDDLAECSKDIRKYIDPTVPFDNMAYLTDQIVDDHILKNHQDWVHPREYGPMGSEFVVPGDGRDMRSGTLPVEGEWYDEVPDPAMPHRRRERDSAE